MFKKKLNLYLFDGEGGEGADAGVATPEGQTAHEEGADNGTEGQEPDRAAEFENLIKGDYKEFYDKRVKETLDKRFKNHEESTKELESFRGFTNNLSSLLGVETTDLTELTNAIISGNSQVEEAAEAMGMTTERYLEYMNQKAENQRLNAELENQRKTEQTQQIYQKWEEEANSLQEIYPNFDLNYEAENNPEFVNLLSTGLPVKTAYEATHINEIMAGTATQVASAVRKSTVDSIRSRGNRPLENGAKNRPGITTKTDPSDFTKDDINKLIERAKRGEKISF